MMAYLKSLRLVLRNSKLGQWLRLRRLLKFDGGRYGRSVIELTPQTDSVRLRALLLKEAHRLEKAFALPNIEEGHSLRMSLQLTQLCRRYLEVHGDDDFSRNALGALATHYRLNQSIEQIETLNPTKELLQEQGLIDEGRITDTDPSTVQLSRSTLEESIAFDFHRFMFSRYSVRVFSDEAVPETLVAKAVAAAVKTPSVCNRQSWKAHLYSGEKKRKILEQQNGNRGFSETIDKIILVTSDLRHFFDVNERNQGWVDGGMFSMSLVLALHAQGIGTCCLNWCVYPDKDCEMRKHAQISEHEVVMMVIALGMLPETFPAAVSPRKKVEEILVQHG